MIQKLQRWILGLIDSVETMPMSAGKWSLYLGSIIVIRHFLEVVASRRPVFHIVEYVLHFPLAYIAPLLALVLVLSLMARERVERVTKLMLLAWLLTLLPPLLDILARGMGGEQDAIGYLLVDPSQIGTAFVNLMNPFYGDLPGATLGIRLEAFVGCLAGALYVFLKTRNAVRTVLTLFAVYVTMFFFFTLPVGLVRVSQFFAPEIRSIIDLFFQDTGVARGFETLAPVMKASMSQSLVDTLVLAPLLVIWYRLYDREGFRQAFRSAGLVRLVYYPLLTLTGIVTGAKLLAGASGLVRITHPLDVAAMISVLLSSFLVALAAGMVSRLNMAQPDNGPEEVSFGFRAALATTVGLSVLAAYTMSFGAMTCVLGLLAALYLYSARPIRLRRFPGVSSLMLGLASLFAFCLGYTVYAGATSTFSMPKSAVTVLVISVGLALLTRNAWDAPDTEPEAVDPWDLGRRLGERRSRILGGVTCALAAILPGIVLQSLPLAVAGVIAGGLAAFVVGRGTMALIPTRLLGILVALLITAYVMGVAGSPLLTGEVAGALKDYSEGLQSTSAPSSSDSELTRVQTRAAELFRAGDFEAAAGAFEQMIAIDPTRQDAYFNLGISHLQSGNTDEAVIGLMKAVELEPEDAEAHKHLGVALSLTGDLEAAKASLSRSIELDPENSSTMHTLARLHAAEGDTDSEYSMLQTVATLDHENSEALARIGDISIERGEYAPATAAYQAALQGRQPPDGLHAKLAQAFYMMGDYESAEREIREEISQNPDAPLPHANLSNMLLAQGRTEEAREELAVARDLADDPALRARIVRQLEGL